MGSSRGADDRARLLDLTSGEDRKPPIVLRSQRGDIRILGFSPSGRWLFAYSLGEPPLLWDMSASDLGRAPKELPLRKDSIGARPTIASFAFSPDEAWLAIAFSSYPNDIVLWPMGTDELIARACRVAARNLTRAEWDQHFKGQQYRDTCHLEVRRK